MAETETSTSTTIAPAPRRDPYLIHCLKETPAWFVLVVVLTGLNMAMFVREFDYLPRLIDQAFGGLLTALFGTIRRAVNTGNTSIQADTVSTPELKTGSMDNAQITADHVGVTTKDDREGQ